jgi:AcrR family transcriptional regulator
MIAKAPTKPGDDDDPVLAAAAAIIAREGIGGLTMRGLADAIGSSTQAIYTRFGGKPGVVEALAASGAAALGDRLAAVPEGLAPGARVVAIAEAYCAYATANPAVFALMGGAAGRSRAAMTGALHPLRRAVTAMGGDITTADAVWAAAHGATMLYMHELLSAEQAHLALSRVVAALTAQPPPPAPPPAPPRGPVAALWHWIKFGSEK